MKYRLLKGHKAKIDDDGQPRKTVINIDAVDTDRRLIVAECENIIVRGANVAGWAEAGRDVTKGKKYGIDIRDGCKNVTFEDASVLGAPEQKTKAHWRQSAANGIIVREDCQDIHFKKPSVSGVHYGMDLRGLGGSVESGAISHVSADHIVTRGDGWVVRWNTFKCSLEVVSYEELHRDYLQMYPGKDRDVIRDILIQANYFGSELVTHQWEKPAQIVLLSDKKGKNIKVLDNQIITHHDLVILLNPCDGAEVRDNTIYTVGDIKPRVEVLEQRGSLRSSGVRMGVNPITAIEQCTAENYPWLPGEKPEYAPEPEPAPVEVYVAESDSIDFNAFVSGLRNTNAPAITEKDYQAAADAEGLSKTIVKAFFTVESQRDGFNPDGSLKVLLERHWVYRLADREDSDALRQISRSAGKANCNQKPGGYLGGVSEYYRAATICASGHHASLRIVLESMSHGGCQMMGFNYKKAGFNSAKEMVEAMHESEVVHLQVFMSFIKAEGIIPYLQRADARLNAGKKPGKDLARVAEIYNGSKHKQYDLKIARAFHLERALEGEIVIRPKRKSQILQTAGVATASNVGALVTGAGAILSQLPNAREVAEKTTVALQAEIDALKAQAAEPNYLLWAVLGFVLLNQLGVIGTIAARIRDRWSGKNP